MYRPSPNGSQQFAPAFAITTTDYGRQVVAAVGTCIECGTPFSPWDGDMVEHLAGRCGQEDCHVAALVRLRIRGNPPHHFTMRAATEQNNLRAKLRGERTPRSQISAERQRRLDSVRALWEGGHTAIEIGSRLGHKHTAVYQDLKALGIDPKQSKASTEATEAREQLREQIAALVESGMQHSEIAPLVNLSTAMVGYHARKLVKSGRLACSTFVGRHRKTK